LFQTCASSRSEQTQYFIKAKFRYASWFQAGSKLVADMFEARRRQASNLSVTNFEPASNQLA